MVSPTILSNTQTNTVADAGRSIVLNANLSYATGTMILSANQPNADPAWRAPGPSNISAASGVSLQAAHLDLILNSDGSDGGNIGTRQPAHPGCGGSPTYVQSLGANAFLTAGAGSNTSFALGDGINTNAVDLGTGSLTLTAAGVTQSAPLQRSQTPIVALPTGISSGNPDGAGQHVHIPITGVNRSSESSRRRAAQPFSGTRTIIKVRESRRPLP